MDTDKKPFWTWDIIGLMALNALLLGAIGVALWAIFPHFQASLGAWLGKVLGL